jgi:hypothetical protein
MTANDCAAPVLRGFSSKVKQDSEANDIDIIFS